MESLGASAVPRSADNVRATHIFTELRSHDDLLLPVRGSKRLKYTCITCSRQYIALGSSHGGLYIFQRDTLKYLQQIGNKEGLTKALFSPNENVVGMVTSGGAVVVWQLNVTSRQKAERVAATQAHRNRQITSLCWDRAGLRLFSGDERGRITVTNTDSSKPSGIFKFQSELVIDVDSSVVQMDFADERLLISTMTRCYLCDPKKRLSFQIGSKLRDGSYGACFLKKSGSEKPSIFCARPGSRMWEANTMCQVLNTHQFKQLLATPPLPVMGKGRDVTFPAEDTEHPAQSLAFPILHPLGNHFLVTWNERGVYVFDPVNVNVVFWTSDIAGLVDVSVSKSSLYCLQQDNHIRKYTLQNIARCASSLYQQSLLIQCSRMVLRFQTQFQRSRARHHMPPRVLHELAKRVAAEDSILGCDVAELAVSAENRVLDVPSAVSSRRSSFDSYDGMRLQSGIYVVRKRLDSECSDDMPLGCDAHMDHMEGNMEWTEKSRQETIQEASPIKVDKGSNEANPTEETSEVGVSFLVEDLSVDPEDETLLLEKRNGKISLVENGSRDMVVQQNDQSDFRGYGLEEGLNELDEQVAESLGIAGEEINVSTDETDSPEGNNGSKESVTDDQRPSRNHVQVESEILLAHENGESSTAKQYSSLHHSSDITHTYENDTEGIDETFKDEPVEQENALKDHDAVICKSESERGKQMLSGGSSLKNDVISTPNQYAFKNSEDHIQEISMKKDEKIGQVIADGFADIQSAHQSEDSVDKDLIGLRQNLGILPLQEIGTTADITLSSEVPVVDGSLDVCSQIICSESPGIDLVEVEGTVLDEPVVVGMGFDSPPMKLVAKDNHAAVEGRSSPTAECQLMGITEINQRKPSSNTGIKNASTGSSVADTSVLQLDVSGIMTNTEVALQDMQSLKSVDEKRGNTHHKIKREVEEGAQNFENQRFTNTTVTGDAVETKELLSGENITILSDLCLDEEKEKEANVYTSGEGSPIQDQEVIKQTAGEESLSIQDHDISIKVEITEVPKRSVNSMIDSDESTLIDVSGFGISPSEKPFHQPIQAEKMGSFDQSAIANLSKNRDGVRPDKGVLLTVLAKGLHQSSSGNESDLSSVLRNEDKAMAMTRDKDVVVTANIMEERRGGGDTWKQEKSKLFVSDDLSINKAIDQDISKSLNSLVSGNYGTLAEMVNEHGEDYSSLPNANSLSNNSAVIDSVISSSCFHKSTESSSESSPSNSDAAIVNQSLPFEQNILNASCSAENLEIVREDDLEIAEEDAQFPDAETELIKSVTGSRYAQGETKLTERSLSLEKIIQEPAVKRKKTKSRVIDITATVASKPSPLQSLAPGSVLYRPTSLPDLSPQSSSQPRPLQRTPSSTIPSPALSPQKEVRRPSPVSSALPSSNLIIAATSGLPHSSGLMETQQIILSSTAQINLKSVKESLTSKLSKTKTFLQSIGDSNPLSPKEGEHDVPPMQPRPSPSSSPISGSPTHKKGASPSVAHRGIPQQHSTGRPQPFPVSSPMQRARPTGEMEFTQELEEETGKTSIDSRLSEKLIESTKSAVPSLRNPHTRYDDNALRSVLQPWVHKLEQTYTSCQAEGIIPWSKCHLLPMTVREDVGRLAMLCLRLDIYANEEVYGSNEEEREQRPGSELQQEGEKYNDFSRLDECRAAFIKRHFNILDRQGVLEVLQYKQGCHHRTMKMLLQCEKDAAWNSKISEALKNGDVQEAFDLLFRADLTSNNLPLSLYFLQSLCGLDSGRALDMMISEFPTIGPWHAYHILQDQTKSKCLILSYVESFLLTHPFAERKEFLEQVMSMKPLVVSLAEAAVTFDTPSSRDLFCDCGDLPKLGSHLIKWSHDHILDLILNSTNVPVDVLLPLFLRAGYWHGAIVLMARMRDQKMDALKLCIQIGDIALISNNAGDLIPSNEEEWRTVLEWMKKCQPSSRGKNNSSERTCLNCGAMLAVCNITRTLTSEVMVVEVGKQETEKTEDGLSPSSQPECDWSIMEPSEPKDQSGNLSEKAVPSKGTDISEEFQCDRKNNDMGNSQSYKEDGTEEFSAPQQSGLENPNISSSLSSLNDSDWIPSVTWQRIALPLVSRLGALKGVELLREVQVPEGMLGREFHQMCIYVSIWEKRQSLLSHAVLEGTDTYLWSKRQPLLGPLLQHTVVKEHQGVIQGCMDTGSEGERVVKAQKLLSQDKLYIEDPGTHWGRTTNLGRMCSVCHQSVAWSPVLQSASCIIFPCGHVFHSHCIPEKACILCFYGNQEMKL